MADINASEFYNLGYGRQSPQIGYGRAQINRQRPMPNAPDLTQSFASGKKIRLAEDAQEQKKRTAQSELDKKVADAMSGGVYLNPVLNEKWKRDVNAIKNRLEKIDKSSNSTLEIQTIIKEAEDKKAFYANQDKRYASAWDASNNIEGYYSDPFVREVQNGDYSDIPDEELDPLFNRSINVEQRLDPTKRVNEIGKPALESLFSNPNYYTVDRGEIEVGDLNEYMNKSTITPKGREYLEAILLSDQVLMDGIEQQIRFGNKPIDAQKFVQDYIDANFSRSSSQFRSESGGGNGVDRTIDIQVEDSGDAVFNDYESAKESGKLSIQSFKVDGLDTYIRKPVLVETEDGNINAQVRGIKTDKSGNPVWVATYTDAITGGLKEELIDYNKIKNAVKNQIGGLPKQKREAIYSVMSDVENRINKESKSTSADKEIMSSIESANDIESIKGALERIGGDYEGVAETRPLIGDNYVVVTISGQDIILNPKNKEELKQTLFDIYRKNAPNKSTKEEPKKQAAKPKGLPEGAKVVSPDDI